MPGGGRPTTCRSARSTCMGNPLLREPLRPEHIKPRLLGHWGTTPGLNFIYAHLNRVIAARDLDMIYVIGPGHGGPGAGGQRLAGGHLQRDLPGRSPRTRRACGGCSRQFSFPGGIPSHVAPETPGSIHEGGELGYALVARLRRRLRQPGPASSLRRRRRRGRDRAAGGQLALEQVPRPGHRRRRAADPAPQRLQDRQPDGAGPHPARASSLALLRGYGHTPYLVEGDDPADDAPAVRRRRSTACLDEIAEIQRRAREDGVTERPRWPMIVLRHAQGLDRPDGGRRPAGRGHLARPPGAAARTSATNAGHLAVAGGVAAQLPARGAVRRRRRAGRRRSVALPRPATGG